MGDQRTLRQLAAPDVNYNGLCIAYPGADTPFELKSGLIHLLPRFNGLAGEDPHKHLKEFQVVCSTTLRPEGVTEDHIKLKAFPFSLQGAAKDWLLYLAPNSITTWNDLKKLFLEKYFPASRAAAIRKEICGIRQGNESLAEYWERFKQLTSSCPQHQISEQLLIQYFYEGLQPMDRNILDAASGGALVDKTPAAAKQLIENMSMNSQQFTTRRNSVETRGVHEVRTSSSSHDSDDRIDRLTSLVEKLVMDRVQPAVLCGMCSSPEHPYEACPILQGGSVTESPQAFAVHQYNQGNNQSRYSIPDLSTNRYHPSWSNHPNLRYGNSSQQPMAPQNPPPVTTSAPSGPSVDDMLNKMAAQMAAQNLQFQQQIGQFQAQFQASQAQFQQRTDASIQALHTQIGQMATDINNIKQGQRTTQLPAQPVINPNASNPNVSSISLRSGKVVEATSGKNEETMKATPEPTVEVTPEPVVEVETERVYRPPIPFPHRIQKNLKSGGEDKEKAILDVLRKVGVNIPLLDVIKQVPRYAKFLKDLCTNKRTMKTNERVDLGRNVSALIQSEPERVVAFTQALPPKCKDPGTFTIPCTIGDKKFENCMLDLGASINVMPTSIFNKLDLGPLKYTGITIQLANRTCARPMGMVEDVLVQVDDLIFPADFYILDMAGETHSSKSPIILGRPFMKTAKTNIDVGDGTMSMKFGDIVAKFNIFDAMKHPAEEHSVFHIELVSETIEDNHENLFSNFPLNPGCDDILSFLDCTNANHFVVCAEIAACLAGDKIVSAVDEKHEEDEGAPEALSTSLDLDCKEWDPGDSSGLH